MITGPEPWDVYPKGRGFVVLRGNAGESLVNDGSGEVAFDADRRDCHFVTEAAARDAIAKATRSAA